MILAPQYEINAVMVLVQEELKKMEFQDLVMFLQHLPTGADES